MCEKDASANANIYLPIKIFKHNHQSQLNMVHQEMSLNKDGRISTNSNADSLRLHLQNLFSFNKFIVRNRFIYYHHLIFFQIHFLKLYSSLHPNNISQKHATVFLQINRLG